MKKKKFKFNLLAAVGVAVAIGTVAFTATEKNDPLEDGWYAISLTGPTDVPINQKIDGKIPDPPPTDPNDCAQELNEGTTCAVHLTFLTETNVLPATVADIDSTEITLGPDARMPE